jgi:heptaprenyl diphosphate synthase
MARLSKGLDRVAFLGALCLFLSTIEYLIPKPFPFFRVGIANLPILFSIDVLPIPHIFLVIFLKVLGQGLVGGTLVSYVFLFSAAGSFASGAAMIAIRMVLKERISLVGVCVIGALFSNVAQIVLARFLLFGEGAWLIAPPFLALGTGTAIFLGVVAERFARTSLWLRRMKDDR